MSEDHSNLADDAMDNRETRGPKLDAVERVGPGMPHLDMHEWFGEPDDSEHGNAAPMRETEPRMVGNEALDVRQQEPEMFEAHSYAIGTPNGIQVAWGRKERLSMYVNNTGANTIYIGPTQAGVMNGQGYPLAPGAQIMLRTLSDLWASAPTGSGICGILDQFLPEGF